MKTKFISKRVISIDESFTAEFKSMRIEELKDINFAIPSFQRSIMEWPINKKVSFIESLYSNQVITPFHFNLITEKNKPVYRILDGLQRFNCIKEYTSDKISLSNEVFLKDTKNREISIGGFFSTLPEALQKFFLSKTMTYNINRNLTSYQEALVFRNINLGTPLTKIQLWMAYPSYKERAEACKKLIENTNVFSKNMLALSKKGGRDYFLAARLLQYHYYEETKPKAILISSDSEDFFSDEKTKGDITKAYNNAIKVFNLFEKIWEVQVPNESKRKIKIAKFLDIDFIITNLLHNGVKIPESKYKEIKDIFVEKEDEGLTKKEPDTTGDATGRILEKRSKLLKEVEKVLKD